MKLPSLSHIQKTFKKHTFVWLVDASDPHVCENLDGWPQKMGMVINPLIEVDIPTIIYLYIYI